MTRLPPPLPDEDALEQRERVRENRVGAPLLFGVLLGAVVGSLLVVSLTAFGVHRPAWIDKAVMYGCILVIGPLAVARYTRRHPNWVETGIAEPRGPHRDHLPNER